MSDENRQMDTTGFWDWFDRSRGSLSVREVERRANVPRGRIGNARSGNWRPTYEVCQSVANGLRMPVKDVLKRAEMVAAADPVTEREETMLLQFRRLPVHEQRMLVDMLQALVEKRDSTADKEEAKDAKKIVPLYRN